MIKHSHMTESQRGTLKTFEGGTAPSPLRHNRPRDIMLHRGWGPRSCETDRWGFLLGSGGDTTSPLENHWASVPAARNAGTTSSRLYSIGDHIPTSNLKLNIDKNMWQLAFLIYFYIKVINVMDHKVRPPLSLIVQRSNVAKKTYDIQRCKYPTIGVRHSYRWDLRNIGRLLLLPLRIAGLLCPLWCRLPVFFIILQFHSVFLTRSERQNMRTYINMTHLHDHKRIWFNHVAHLFKRMPKIPWAQRGPRSDTRDIVAPVVREGPSALSVGEGPGRWERLPPTEAKSHEDKALSYA